MEAVAAGGDRTSGGGLLSAALCVSGSVLALLALPSLFAPGGELAGVSMLAAASGGGLLAFGVGLSLPPSMPGADDLPAATASQRGAPGHGAA